MANVWSLFIFGPEGDKVDVIRGAQSPFVQLRSVLRNFTRRPAACLCLENRNNKLKWLAKGYLPRVALEWTLIGKTKRDRDQRTPSEGQ